MWILEHDGDVFHGKKLWLRPGKRYLFGRTLSEPGQFVISDKTVSRKHILVEVAEVAAGDGTNLRKQSKVTVEDLKTKTGTRLNGLPVKGEKQTLTEDVNELKIGLGNNTGLFRISWRPYVFSFSFSSKELRNDPWVDLRQQLEQLDIKFIADYDIQATTHVVSKKRNTVKGLQALINGKYIVSDEFTNAVVAATSEPASDTQDGSCRLERDFEGNWPDAMNYLPVPGEGANLDKPDTLYGPDARRTEIFEGYTFVFYNQKQHESLFPAISNGKGKVLLYEVEPQKTDVGDFVRYVKEVAGDKGLGVFEDGNEGRGVVVVRYVPAKDDDAQWYTCFLNAFAVRLDHRPIDQREFLEAILDVRPAMLRKPLQFEESVPASGAKRASPAARATSPATSQPSQIQRARPSRRAPASRFKGFGMSAVSDKEPDEPEPDQATRKRPASPPPPPTDLMDDIAPTAAAIKRRRLDAGEEPIRAAAAEDTIPDSDAEFSAKEDEKPAPPVKGRKKKVPKDTDEILDRALQQREAADAEAKAERERLVLNPDDEIDYNEIRRLTLVETMEVRQPQTERTREQDIQDGRWDPKWNGRKNFKRFRKQGEAAGRPLQRIIMSVEPVKMKEYGIGDDYWLEGSSHGDCGKKAGIDGKTQSQETQQQTATQPPSTADKSNGRRNKEFATIGSDTVDDEILDDGDGDNAESTMPNAGNLDTELPRSKKGKDMALRGQSQTQSQSQADPKAVGKRLAAESPVNSGRQNKKAATRATMPAHDSDDDSDDGRRFRFGKRK